MTRPLGSIQRDLLISLGEHGGWHARSGWVWDTVRGTQRRLDALVKRGLVVRDDEGNYKLKPGTVVPERFKR